MPKFDQRLIEHLLVCDQDFGLIQRNVERFGVDYFGTDQAEILGQVLQLATQRDDIALLQTHLCAGADALSATNNIDDAILRKLLPKLRDGLARGRIVLELVGTESGGPEPGQAGVIDVRNA